MNHDHDLGVGHEAGRSDRIEIALHELAVTTALSPFASPYGTEVVPLERDAQLRDVLCCVPCERDGEVEPEPDMAASVVLEPVELPVGLFATLAGEDFQILECRRVDRTEAEGTEERAGAVHDRLAHEHRFGKKIAEALQRSRFDRGHVSSSPATEEAADYGCRCAHLA